MLPIMKKTICVAGPTCAGSTFVANNLAKYLDGRVLSGDHYETLVFNYYPEFFRSIYHNENPKTWQEAKKICDMGTVEQYQAYNSNITILVENMMRRNMTDKTTIIDWKQSPASELWTPEKSVFVNSYENLRAESYNKHLNPQDVNLSKQIIAKHDNIYANSITAAKRAKHCIFNNRDENLEKQIVMVAKDLQF